MARVRLDVMAATHSRRARSGPDELTSGPWKSVYDTDDPFDASPDILVDATNMYIPDPVGGSGAYARPGFLLLNGGSPVYSVAAPFRCQAIYPHTQLDGSTVNLVVIAGRLFRANGTYGVYTDVTPAGITIDPSIATRVYFASLIGTLIVTDGVHRPWICTDPSAATLTATSIDYDGLGGAWTAYGAPAIYGGAVFFILNQVNGVSRRADISWCNPGTPLVGWQQPDSDNNWTLSQNEAGNLYVLIPTNFAMYYTRERSIGYFTGTVGPDLASTATHDAVAFNVGAQTASLVQQFGTAIFFGDANGRPYLFQPGVPPRDIWKQMRNVVRDSTTGFPGTTQITATSCLETNLNLYCAAIWSPSPSTQAAPTEMVVFDANAGTYAGRWMLAGSPGIECMGTFVDAAGRATMLVATSGGYLWGFSGFAAPPEDLAIEGRGALLATEDLAILTTEGTPENWKDNGVLPAIAVQTDRLGYAGNTVYNVDLATVITLTDTPCTVTVQTTTASTVEGTPTPSPSADGTYRLVAGCDSQGRGPAVLVSPTAADTQWAVQQITLAVIPSRAGPDDA